MLSRIGWMILLAALPSAAHPQNDTSSVSWFPRDLLFSPLLANHDEPVMGLEQQLGSSVLRVGIGNSVDLIEYRHASDTLRWGADFFSFSLASTIRDVRLKIDAADGFFGVHVAWTNDSPWMIRFRAIHQSAHLVDGHYNSETGAWDNNRQPIPFSRNYGDIVGAYRADSRGIELRVYAGPNFAVYNNPKDIRRLGGVLGCEAHTRWSTSVYAAFSLSLLGVPVYNGSSTLETGVKFGDWSGRGIRLYLTYYNGLDLFGEYYKERKEFGGIGFAIDVW